MKLKDIMFRYEDCNIMQVQHFGQVIVFYSKTKNEIIIVKQETMRMRQHSDKTGTKQIRCLKLTSKYQNDQNFFSAVVKTSLIPREDYITLYVDTVRKVAVQEDPSRFFVVSRSDQKHYSVITSTFILQSFKRCGK